MLKFKIIKKEVFVLILLIFLSACIRSYYVSDQNIIAWFDQTRDGIVATEIINGDIKIQGPSASGTHDQIFHGVLFYYLLAVPMAILGKDFSAINMFFAILFSINVVPVYYFVKLFTKSKLSAFISALLFSVSIDVISTSTWLSNPILMTLSVPICYLYLWKLFSERNWKYLWIVLFAFGISNQAAIFSLYLGFPIVLVLALTAFSSKPKKYPTLKQIMSGLLAYLMAISTMILTQVKLYMAGIFKIETLLNLTTNKIGAIDKLKGVHNLIEWKLYYSLFPIETKVTFFVFLLLLIYFPTFNPGRKAVGTVIPESFSFGCLA